MSALYINSCWISKRLFASVGLKGKRLLHVSTPLYWQEAVNATFSKISFPLLSTSLVHTPRRVWGRLSRLDLNQSSPSPRTSKMLHSQSCTQKPLNNWTKKDASILNNWKGFCCTKSVFSGPEKQKCFHLWWVELFAEWTAERSLSGHWYRL